MIELSFNILQVISSSGKKLESRLVREEDEADDVDAGGCRIISVQLKFECFYSRLIGSSLIKRF